MFDNATVGGDTMAEISSSLFRLPIAGKPMTIMQLGDFPAEVVDSVVSVLCRKAFDFGLWSDGISPLLFVCEEAHRYAPAEKTIGFGLVAQRRGEIDPTILSQCSSLKRDDGLIRSAVSDAALVVCSLAGHAGSVRLRYRLCIADAHAIHRVAARPAAEQRSNTRSDAGRSMDHDLLGSVIERWRSASMSHRALDDEPSFDAPSQPPSCLRRSHRRFPRACSRSRLMGCR
jgi:hypothetical protein